MVNFERFNKITWYPGHMLKAQRQLKEKLKLIDLAVEVVDARAPELSRNDQLMDIFQHKATITLVTKTDLISKDLLKSWQDYYKKENRHVFFINSSQKKAVTPFLSFLEYSFKEERKRRGATTPMIRPPRVAIVGVPNVGKSTLINLLVAGKRTQTGPRPGVTRSQQWVKLKNGMELLDTPGVMVPSINNPEKGLQLTLLGMIKDKIAGEEALAEYIHYMWVHNSDDPLMKRYELKEFPKNYLELLEAIAKRYKLFKGGAEPDLRQAATSLIQDLRQGKLGKIGLQSPEMLVDEEH